ncbi:MAG: hypothetical protein JNL74_23820 [Fibrobacteres bacterium]|nr:hypothetical protein [Fibrobacterota bacterium]
MVCSGFISRSFRKVVENKSVFLNIIVQRDEVEKIIGRSLSDDEMQKLSDAVADGLATHYEDEIAFAAEALNLRY